jgi:hypothetical protein
MAMLHDAPVRAALEARLARLRADSRGRWGRMSVDQMLWHLNQVIRLSLGTLAIGPAKAPLPPGILKVMVLYLPWFKGAPTHRDLVARAQYDFTSERDDLQRLVGEVASRPLSGPWPHHPTFGRMTGREVSRLLAKHIDHHLRQFGT